MAQLRLAGCRLAGLSARARVTGCPVYTESLRALAGPQGSRLVFKRGFSSIEDQLDVLGQDAGLVRIDRQGGPHL